MVQTARVGKKHFSEKKFGRRKSIKQMFSSAAHKLGLKKRHDEEDPHNVLEEFRQMKISEYTSQPLSPSAKSIDCDWKHSYDWKLGYGGAFSPLKDPRSPCYSDSSCSSTPTSTSRRLSGDSTLSSASGDSPAHILRFETVEALMENLVERYSQQQQLCQLVVQPQIELETQTSECRLRKKRVRRQSSKSTKAMKPPHKKSKFIPQCPHISEIPDLIPDILEQIAKVVWLQIMNFEDDQMVDLEWECFNHPRIERHQRGETPTLEEINHFVKSLHQKSTPSEECVLIALMFLHRLIRYSSFRLHAHNWVSALFTAALIAQKIWDDESWINEHFGYFCSDWDNRALNKMESSFLAGVDWDCSISEKEYAWYFEKLFYLGEDTSPILSSD